jgi:transposase-like protein
MADQGISVTHTTIMRWVILFVPEYERRWARFARPVGTSWRMDETAVRVRGRVHYVYRAVDRAGKSVPSMLAPVRTVHAATLFFRGAIEIAANGLSSRINLDKYFASHLALRSLGDEDERWRSVQVRDRRYLSNVVEQDHCAIKRRCACMLGFKSTQTAAVTIAGIELAHRVRKQQFELGGGGTEERADASSLKSQWERALALDSVHDEAGRTGMWLLHQISFNTVEGNPCTLPRAPRRYPRKDYVAEVL